MYRVELKDALAAGWLASLRVPNVPCGVERLQVLLCQCPVLLFLMYRMELKVIKACPVRFQQTWFLMYRMELKVAVYFNILHLRGVPNVPYGVER